MMELNRVRWDGEPLTETIQEPFQLPVDDLFDLIPPAVPVTSKMEELAAAFVSGRQMNDEEYGGMLAAASLLPASAEAYEKRRRQFLERFEEAESRGLRIPEAFVTLVMSNDYLDRLHNSIWPVAPEELVALPSDPSRTVFLAVQSGHSGCGWHMLLDKDKSHCVVYSPDAFGTPSDWPKPPDYSQFEVAVCADSMKEWLYYCFLDFARHTASLVKTYEAYVSG